MVVSLFPHSRSPLSAAGYALERDINKHALSEIAASLGSITTDPRHPHNIRFLSPQALADAEPNTLSSRYGMGQFPFHTDAAHWHRPPDYLLLYCAAVGSGNRPTYLIDTQSWCLTKAELLLLCNAVWRSGHVKPFLCTAARRSGDGFLVRYDPGCMSPRSKRGIKAAHLVANKLENSKYMQIDWQNNDLLIIDNRRTLHARGPAEQPDPDRVIARILIGGSYECLGL